MTKHRKILEGVSEGPWELRQFGRLKNVVDSSNRVACQVAKEENAEFVKHARNQWPAICDLIEAVDELLENLAYDHKMDFPKVEAALDKLNEN